MTIDPRLEQRVQAELQRAAPQDVPGAPSVDEMESTVAGRRRRNRLLTGVGAAVVALGAIGGAALAIIPDSSSTDLIATAPESDAEDTSDGNADQASGEQDETGNTGGEGDESDAADPTTNDLDRAAVEPDTGAGGDPFQAPSEETTEVTTLQADGAEVTVQTQQSAVEFAGGSGVFLTADGNGFRGVASRFGGDAGVSAIGLQSDDGLDWTEVELVGVPAGTTATALTSYDGRAVALFSQFDVDEQRNLTFVGTSDDLAEWTLSEALPGQTPIATGLAAGANGVIVVGVAPNPTVWTGPLDGPFEQVGSIDGADTLAGVISIEGGFVAVGTTAEFGPTLFDSVDGVAWLANPMSTVGDDDTVVSLAVTNGTIMLAGDDGDVAWATMSSDGGQSWTRSEIDAGMVSSVRSTGTTIGFLGTSPLGASTVTLSDGESWSSADLEVAAPDRIELLVAASDQAVLLATVDETLTWIVARR